MSNAETLPKYEPLHMTLTVNGTAITADENGVYHAYVGENPGTLTVNCTADSITVTRMDSGADVAPDETTSDTAKIMWPAALRQWGLHRPTPQYRRSAPPPG